MTQQETQPLVVPYHREPADSLTKYDLGVLAVRLVGLYCLFYALVYAAFIPNLLIYRAPGVTQSGLAIAAACAPSAVFAVAGLVLLRWTGAIVQRVFPEFAAGTGLSATGRDLQAVLFSVIGVWLVAEAVPEAARIAMNYWWFGSAAYSAERYGAIPEVAHFVVQIAVGVYLFARAKGLAALWHRLRTAGVSGPKGDSV